MKKKSVKERVLKALKESRLVDEKVMEEVIKEAQTGQGSNVINMLVDKGMVSDHEILSILSMELKIPTIALSRIALDEEMMNLLPENLAKRYSVIPLSRIANDLTVIVSDPTDVLALDDVKTVTGCNVELILATRNEVQEALRSFYEPAEESISAIIEAEKDGSDVAVLDMSESLDILEITQESSAAPIVKVVDLVISEAIKRRASDIHVEPQEKTLRIRYRIDGELHTVFDLPKKNQNAILARLKIMSNLDITETRVPQDGRFRIKLGKKEIDFRVSVLPVSFGNKIVLRALDRSNLSIGLESLGFLPGPLADFKEALSRPFGIILVTGPTGSGKSTTLYSVLSEMNVPERNIITVEDPVEYQVGGITQIATRTEIGLNFANGLRAILRQSPDVIMVGEIRDFETADIAIKASLTGQKVLSTLHTNDAVGAITRLENMGIEPFLVASSLIMVCAQRLLRKVCPHCKAEIEIPQAEIKKISEAYPEILKVKKFYKGKGCDKCSGTGYHGRGGTLETVLVDDTIKEMINKKKSEEEIHEYLRSRGVKTLRDNAMTKFMQGITTLEEVYRVT